MNTEPAPKSPAPPPEYRIGVKALCQFTAKRGDLDRRFTPAPTARQGMAGHALVAARRGPGYHAEVTLTSRQGSLMVRGRADGYLPDEARLEECKTHRGSVDRIPDNHRALHWAQLQTYAAMLCERDGLEQLTLALVYFDIDDQCETVLEEVWSAEDLLNLFRDRCETFAAWAARELLHQSDRDQTLRALVFPFGGLHTEQRRLAEAVYRLAARSGRLLVEAPTGVGKTLGTLFPLLKALSVNKIDKIYYLTAKSTGRALVLDAVEALRRTNPRMNVRVLDLVAREKTCVHPDKECQGSSCPLARGFYDRVASARTAAATLAVMDQSALRSIAEAHQVCAYYLSQEMIRWADVVVADYNHFFDSSAMLYAIARESEWSVGVLVDEAHNLVPRARQMYSSQLNELGLVAAIRSAPISIRGCLRRVERLWSALKEKRPASYAVMECVPEPLVVALRAVVADITDWTVSNEDRLPEPVQLFHFAALEFLRLLDSLGDHSLLEWTIENSGAQIGIRNLIPAPFLASRMAAAKSIALFSATLSPQSYYREMLGLQDECESLVADSPFDAEQLEVNVVTNVSTRFRDRQKSLRPAATLVARQFEKAPGNYLLFAGSFEYLRQLEGEIRASYPGIPLWSQTARMTETDRRAFTQRFVAEGTGIGLAVLGGAFAEGIDLPGSRLIGAFVLTLGLPAVDPSNEEARKRFEKNGGRGYEYAYLYPGLQRVVQAAGRVIRSTSDKGVLFLIDDRYRLPEVRELMPSWWKLGAAP